MKSMLKAFSVALLLMSGLPAFGMFSRLRQVGLAAKTCLSTDAKLIKPYWNKPYVKPATAAGAVGLGLLIYSQKQENRIWQRDQIIKTKEQRKKTREKIIIYSGLLAGINAHVQKALNTITPYEHFGIWHKFDRQKEELESRFVGRPYRDQELLHKEIKKLEEERDRKLRAFRT